MHDDDDNHDERLPTTREPPHPKPIEFSSVGDRWPILPTDGGWVEVRNPTSEAARAEVFFGPDPQIGVALERLRPKEDQLSQSEIQNRIKKMLPVRGEYTRVMLRWAPGETLRIPRSFLQALRRVRNGQVVSGLFPRCEVIGEENPPVHPALSPEPERLPAPPQRRGKASNVP